MIRRLAHITLFLVPLCSLGQTEFVVNQGTDIRINPGCQVILAEGGIQNQSGELSNAGELVVEGSILNDGTLSGGTTSGTFRVLNDVENNGYMIPGQSLFELYGDAQFLRGSNQLDFYDLTLIGSGVKYMQQSISTGGTLDLTDRELRAATNTVFHTNTTSTTVLAIHNEGFVSADEGGGLSRATAGSGTYFFPLGSTVDNFKVRPITIEPLGAENTYKARYAPGPTPLSVQRGPELFYVNPIFYHHVERTEGVADAGLTVFYDDVEDGYFETLASLQTDFWRDNVGTTESDPFGASPELKSFRTPDYNFTSTEVALAAYASELFVPNVFSPNEDGRNDVFKPRGTEPFEYELRIYDRWGNLVFSSTEIETGWDGRFNGKPMNSAVFVYYILSGGSVIDKGNVTLLR